MHCKIIAVVCGRRRSWIFGLENPRKKSGILNLEANAFDPPEGSLRKSVGRGAVVTAMAQSVRVATQILSVV
ncbi:lipopolysaccharide biosynthesis protein, partial [Mesorhizobium sp. M7A.F.Ca.US.003.02.2.1]